MKMCRPGPEYHICHIADPAKTKKLVKHAEYV